MKKDMLKSQLSRYRFGAYVRLSPSDEIRDEGSLVSHPQRMKSFVEYKNSQEPGWGEIVETYTDKDFRLGLNAAQTTLAENYVGLPID